MRNVRKCYALQRIDKCIVVDDSVNVSPTWGDDADDSDSGSDNSPRAAAYMCGSARPRFAGRGGFLPPAPSVFDFSPDKLAGK